MIHDNFRNGIVQNGSREVRRAAQALASVVPSRLAPLARVAYNYRWTWHPDGDRVFRDIDPYRWRMSGRNPVRLLQEAPQECLERAAGHRVLVERLEALADSIDEDLSRPPSEDGIPGEHPVAFLCSEYGIHRSLPVYSGGLGALAGDILKSASDRALPMMGIGIMYRQGYFHQRVDASGWQHEYWYETDPERRPAVKIADDAGRPVQITVPIWGESVTAHVWRVEVGRVPLFLLDTVVEENSPRHRFISSRLYEGNRQVRLAQYALLGVGGMRLLHVLGVEPSVTHINEGHPALATLEVLDRLVQQGRSFSEATDEVRRRFVFTTHTPVPAGNETYEPAEMQAVFPDVAEHLGEGWNRLLSLGRVDPDSTGEPPGMTPLALRMSRHVNGVSRIHAEVSRSMWQRVFGAESPDDVPISHVTNGVHLPSWMCPDLRGLLDRHLGEGWCRPEHVTDPATWEAVDRIPDTEIWEVRNAARRRLVHWVRSETVTERLARGETMEHVERAARAFDPGALTLGFARRLATYKRLHLVTRDLPRFLRLIEGPRGIQFLFAGKAHPLDDEAKQILRQLFEIKSDTRVAGRVAFFEDYNLGKAQQMLCGCDVWINLPRPPQEASGTSGMKSALSGGLNLSVLDGWWAEGFDGENGWGIDGTPEPDEGAKDARDAEAFYDLLEREVIPLFHDRDEHGVPVGWVQRIKRSLRTIGPRFCADRMLDQYVNEIYRS